jgi:hypothetical protein
VGHFASVPRSRSIDASCRIDFHEPSIDKYVEPGFRETTMTLARLQSIAGFKI